MPEPFAKITVGLVLLLFLFGCGGTPDRETGEVVREEPIPVHTRDVIVTGDGRPAEGCRPKLVAEVLIYFFDAFNQGSREDLSRVFFVSEGPSPPEFSPVGYEPWSWFSSSEIGTGGKVLRHFTTSDQAELLGYFARRHERGESLRLLKVGLTQAGVLDEESNVGFVFVAVRDAPDLDPDVGGPDRIAYGKGALNCDNLRIFAWRMDMKTGEQRTKKEAAAWLCLDPPRWRPGEAVVACS